MHATTLAVELSYCGRAAAAVEEQSMDTVHPLLPSDETHLLAASPGYSHACFLNAQHSFAGRKFEHALKHGPTNGLFVVTLGWFIDCVRRNMRLDESLYSIRNIGESGRPLGEFNRLVGAPVSEKLCLPPMVFQDKACSDATQKRRLQAHREEPEHDVFVFANHTIYIDPGISGEMKKKEFHGARSNIACLEAMLKKLHLPCPEYENQVAGKALEYMEQVEMEVPSAFKDVDLEE
ncbi:hypothetical protein ACQ4PT_040072 [Festuca glaucescens]